MIIFSNKFIFKLKAPMNPKTNNDYYPNQPLAKPQTIPGTMYDTAGKKPALPGNLIVNKNAPPYSFVSLLIGNLFKMSAFFKKNN